MANKNMPFGKYKGKTVSELPDSYIAWLMKKCELKEPLKTWVEEVIWEKVCKDKKEELIKKWVDSNYTERPTSSSYNDPSFSDHVMDDYDCPYDAWDAYGNLYVDFLI